MNQPPFPPQGQGPPGPPQYPQQPGQPGQYPPAAFQGTGAPQPEQGQPGVAVGSLATGIPAILTSWCCLGVPLGIAAIVLGILGRRQAAERGVGTGMATAGLVCGGIALVLVVLFTILGVVSGSLSGDFDTS